MPVCTSPPPYSTATFRYQNLPKSIYIYIHLYIYIHIYHIHILLTSCFVLKHACMHVAAAVFDCDFPVPKLAEIRSHWNFLIAERTRTTPQIVSTAACINLSSREAEFRASIRRVRVYGSKKGLTRVRSCKKIKGEKVGHAVNTNGSVNTLKLVLCIACINLSSREAGLRAVIRRARVCSRKKKC